MSLTEDLLNSAAKTFAVSREKLSKLRRLPDSYLESRSRLLLSGQLFFPVLTTSAYCPAVSCLTGKVK